MSSVQGKQHRLMLYQTTYYFLRHCVNFCQASEQCLFFRVTHNGLFRRQLSRQSLCWYWIWVIYTAHSNVCKLALG